MFGKLFANTYFPPGYWTDTELSASVSGPGYWGAFFGDQYFWPEYWPGQAVGGPGPGVAAPEGRRRRGTRVRRSGRRLLKRRRGS